MPDPFDFDAQEPARKPQRVTVSLPSDKPPPPRPRQQPVAELPAAEPRPRLMATLVRGTGLVVWPVAACLILFGGFAALGMAGSAKSAVQEATIAAGAAAYFVAVYALARSAEKTADAIARFFEL